MTGLDVQRQSPVKARWVLLSGFAESGIVQKALDLGFVGVISKTTLIPEQLQVLTRLIAGASIALDSRSQLCLRGAQHELEPQAAQMVRSAVVGESTKIVAKRLGVTVRMVQRTLEEVNRRYHIKSPAGLLAFARQQRLIDYADERPLLT
jgi:DNA-binding NarL/FixJ family response regulator